MGAYALVLVAAGVVTYAATPLVLFLVRKIGAVDIPDDRKVHAAPTPTLGGTAIFVGFIAAFVVAASLERFAAAFRPLVVWPLNEPVGIAVSAALIYGLGALDDLRGLRAPAKFAGQLLAAGLVFISGVRLEYLKWPFGTDALVLSPELSAIATILWIVAIVNAVNLIDGLDGLAAGITAIAAATFFVYTYNVNSGLAAAELLEQNAPLLSVIIVGTALGFLRYNFNPAKIFMGDSGSMTLGFLLATATVVGIGRSAQNPIPETLLFYLPLLVPLIVLAIPILDTALAIVRRARRGKHIFQADKEHLHHRLLEIGHGHRQAVLIMYGWAAVIAGGALSLSFVGNPVVTWVLGAAGVAIFLYMMLPRLARFRL